MSQYNLMDGNSTFLKIQHKIQKYSRYKRVFRLKRIYKKCLESHDIKLQFTTKLRIKLFKN